ncbi:MAG: DUF3656 domain-containing protein, partial [Oscillospiraceae bacterium]|nr:DUF3656 domain-containing protein [Oscillospiraceae bacterium]
KENLKKVFSRTGFTDGYFTGRLTKEMFGRREHEDVTAANSEVLGQIRKTASSPCKHFAVDMHLCAKIGQPAKLTAKCGGLEVTQISEKICESAANTALTHEKAQQQLAKTGGTQYKLGTLTAQIEHGLALPLAELNQMRRSVLEELDEKRCKNYNYKINPIDFNFLQKPYKKEQNAQPLNIAYLKDENIAITHSQYDIVFLPLFADKNRFLHLQKQGIAVGAELPRVMFGIEPAILNRAKELAELGVNDFCLHNLGAVELLADLPVNKHGGFGLNICNTAALLWAEKAGLCSVTLSPELRLEQIENLGGNIARNALFFGLVPLTISRICPYKNAGRDCKTCKSEKFLQDRKGEKRTVFCQKNYVEILNNRVLSAPEKVSKSTAIDGLVYSFYVENYVETVDNPYEITQKPDVENNFTRGLYTRGVE